MSMCAASPRRAARSFPVCTTALPTGLLRGARAEAAAPGLWEFPTIRSGWVAAFPLSELRMLVHPQNI